MAQSLLDHEAIRRNFERADRALLEPAPNRLAHVRVPLDPYAAAQPLLARLQLEIDSEFPEQRLLLAPFITRTAELLARMQAVAATPDDARELRVQFVAALNDLEDLCEALLHARR